LNRVESTELTRAITVVYTQDYPITLSMDGIDQMSRLAVYLCISIPLWTLDISFVYCKQTLIKIKHYDNQQPLY